MLLSRFLNSGASFANRNQVDVSGKADVTRQKSDRHSWEFHRSYSTFVAVFERHIVFLREGTSGARNRKPRGEMCESRDSCSPILANDTSMPRALTTNCSVLLTCRSYFRLYSRGCREFSVLAFSHSCLAQTSKFR